jgi:hypothetical protein
MRKIFFGFKLNFACDGKDIKMGKLFGFNIVSIKHEKFIKLKFIAGYFVNFFPVGLREASRVS